MSAPPQTHGEDERLNRLRLARSENVGPIIYRELLRRFGSAGRALENLPQLAQRAGRKRSIRLCPRDQAEAELSHAEEIGATLLILGDDRYPKLLSAIDDPPPVLTILGNHALLSFLSVAIVGARNASANGRRFARQLAAGLGGENIVVVSGLARGIDTAAHEGALATGTIAVVASGIDIVYPRENETLYDMIREGGAIVAENPPGTAPAARNFPRRNRIISGLSLGVLVIEAAMRSGSLITARMAAEQGREVFAVPGSPIDARCRGTNNLLREGATLVESVEDVIAVIRPMSHGSMAETRSMVHRIDDHPGVEEISAAHESVRKALGTTPIGIDDLARECGLSSPLVAAVLVDLELAGRLERYSGGRVALTGES